jgi:hypothetical protein
MSQEETLNTATLPPQPEATTDSATLVSTYADALMAGLFNDVDKLLEGDEAALAVIEADLSATKSDQEALVLVSEAENTSLATARENALATATTSELDFFDAEAANPTPAPATKPRTRLGKWFDRLLLTSTALSLMGIVAFLWMGQRNPALEVGLGQAPMGAASGQPDAEFLAYLQRSLDVITKNVEQGAVSTQTAPTPGMDLSLVPVTPSLLPPTVSSTGALGNQPINVIERVYVPYQTTQPLGSAPTQPGAVTPMPQTITPPANGSASPPQPVTPGVRHVLVGVLELGNRSAALFEINGVPQRVYIGERIGNSGWSLVSVSNEEAVIRRNGDVRSIYIGQQF